MSVGERPYHHGDLRRALIQSALDLVADKGPAALSLREVARRAGVSHAAPTHHFGDKTGLLTAIAAEGWGLLADALQRTNERTGDFAEVGVTYVLFATTHPAHFAVMRGAKLIRADDPDLAAAQARAGSVLRAGAGGPVADGPDARPVDRARAIAAWALVHGLAALIEEGNVALGQEDDVAELARAVIHRLKPGDQSS